ncbi:hypothetical protein N0V82_006297 [Gnomoniopsis sp. IMI 355080]|nr:hypothetical protein N0V82_006297 [Gnomoniopsis sp. IMI 355080]
MEEMSLDDLRKTWRKHVANAGSVPEAQCYKNSMKEICQVLATAFAPSHDDEMIPWGSCGAVHHSMHSGPSQAEQGNNLQPPVPQPTYVHHELWPHSTTIVLPTSEQTVPYQMNKEQYMAMEEAYIQENNMAVAKWIAETQDATKKQDAEEQLDSTSVQSTEKTNETAATVTQVDEDSKKLSDSTSVAEAAAQAVATIETPSPPPTNEAIRSFYLHLIYEDRLTLFNNPAFLLVLAEQPVLSHNFFRFLIDYPFGTRYTDRYGSNANHGLIPFPVPFPPVPQDLPLGMYFDNRWALLNDPAWLWWVSTEFFIMASFWAEMSGRGGIGAMQRSKELTERPSRFHMAPF